MSDPISRVQGVPTPRYENTTGVDVPFQSCQVTGGWGGLSWALYSRNFSFFVEKPIFKFGFKSENKVSLGVVWNLFGKHTLGKELRGTLTYDMRYNVALM